METKESVLYETITIEKYNNGDRIKFMSFTVKASEKSDLTKLVMNLLITIAEKHGYSQYFNTNLSDPLAVSENVKKKNTISVLDKYFKELSNVPDGQLDGNNLYSYLVSNGVQFSLDIK